MISLVFCHSKRKLTNVGIQHLDGAFVCLGNSQSGLCGRQALLPLLKLEGQISPFPLLVTGAVQAWAWTTGFLKLKLVVREAQGNTDSGQHGAPGHGSRDNSVGPAVAYLSCTGDGLIPATHLLPASFHGL